MKTLNPNLSIKFIDCPPSTDTAQSALVIFLHGRMANELDMLDLASAFTPYARVLSTRAPITMGPGQFGWFKTEYPPSKPPIHDEKQASESQALLIRFIHSLKECYGVDYKRIFLFGFSQGSIMSFSIAFSHPELVGGIVCQSGRILPEHVPTRSVPELRGFPAFISHGIYDDILGIHYARSARETAEKLGIDLCYREYESGHDISEENFEDSREWLIRQITSPSK